MSRVSTPPIPASSGELARPRWGWLTARTLGRWAVRCLSLVGVGLIVLSLTGWWLSTRVLSDSGFADVAVKTVQQPVVRDYFAHQISAQLAPTNKIFTAAPPVTNAAISAILNNDAVTSAVYRVVRIVHHQVFALGNTNRVGTSAQNTAATLKAALRNIDPKIADRVDNRLLSTASRITSNKTIDLAAHAATWIEALYIPIGVVGILQLLLVFSKAREPAHAVRFAGFTMAVAGAVPIGLGFATPLFAAIGGSGDAGRGQAIAAFVHVLLGRLVGAGWALSITGLLLALAPGRDGSAVGVRLRRGNAWFDRARRTRLGQLIGGVIVVAVGTALLTVPRSMFTVVGFVIALLIVFCGFVVILRAFGVLETSALTPRLRARQFFSVVAAVVVLAGATTAGTATLIKLSKSTPGVGPLANGCNGSYELCLEPLNQIMWPASHNAMSSISYDSIVGEQTKSIPAQLQSGAKALLLDAYYGYPQDGSIRTNFTGAINRRAVQAELGSDAVRQLARLGALTGSVSTTPRHGQDVYLCHMFCELGAVKASTVFAQINQYLTAHPTDVLMLDMEDYVKPADLKKALQQGGLWDRVYTPDLAKPLPTLLDLVRPPRGADQASRRVIVTSENHANQAPWLLGTYQLMQETPYTFRSVAGFNCDPNRGASTNPMFLLNHWLRASGPPDPVSARFVNSAQVLTHRIEQCVRQRHQLPNLIAVDFFGIGDTVAVCNRFNSAVARLTGVSARLDRAARTASDPNLVAQQRLAEMSRQQAVSLLGPIAASLRSPPSSSTARALQPIGGSTQPSTAEPPSPAPSRSGR